jgi:flagellar FliL protein
MMIIGLIALLVLGGGGAGAYFYFMKPAEAAATADGAKDGHDKAKAEKHAEEGDGHGAHHEFVELSPLILPIVNADGLSQTVSLVIAIEVASPEDKAKVENLTPRLNDAYIQDMYGMLGDQAALKGGMIQVGEIKNRLNIISGKVLGEGVVKDVLLQVVQQRPI